MHRLSICLIALALSACADDKRAAGTGKAGGEILPGSVSDAMLPVDTVRSQAPLAPKVEAASKDKADPAQVGEASAAADAAPPEAPAAAEAAPE